MQFKEKKCIDKDYVAMSFLELYKQKKGDKYFKEIISKKGKKYDIWKEQVGFFSTGFYYDLKHGMINFHSLMTVLYIASNSK